MGKLAVEQACGRPCSSLHPWQPQLDGSLHRLVVAQLILAPPFTFMKQKGNAGRTPWSSPMRSEILAISWPLNSSNFAGPASHDP